MLMSVWGLYSTLAGGMFSACILFNLSGQSFKLHRNSPIPTTQPQDVFFADFIEFLIVFDLFLVVFAWFS